MNKFKNEIKKAYENYGMNGLKHISEISCYNHNYYIGIPRGKGKGKVDLLLGVTDDDDTTEWYVVDGLDGCKHIGYSLISQGDSMNIYLNL